MAKRKDEKQRKPKLQFGDLLKRGRDQIEKLSVVIVQMNAGKGGTIVDDKDSFVHAQFRLDVALTLPKLNLVQQSTLCQMVNLIDRVVTILETIRFRRRHGGGV